MKKFFVRNFKVKLAPGLLQRILGKKAANSCSNKAIFSSLTKSGLVGEVFFPPYYPLKVSNNALGRLKGMELPETPQGVGRNAESDSVGPPNLPEYDE